MSILITGTSRGIGAGLVAHYRDLGQDVIGTERSETASAPLDVTDPASHQSLSARLGDMAIELLICNAGVYLDKGADLDSGYPASLWADTFAANVTGVFLTIQALLPNLRRAENAKIAIISSKMGSDAHAPGGSYIYRASKAAVLNLGRNLSEELKPQGIAVGIYHPGWVQTDMGGSNAEVMLDQAVPGLAQRFDDLSIASTGCFEAYDGEQLPF